MRFLAASKKLSEFDTKTFLSTVNGGRMIEDFPRSRRRLIALVHELSDLLERKERRLSVPALKPISSA